MEDNDENIEWILTDLLLFEHQAKIKLINQPFKVLGYQTNMAPKGTLRPGVGLEYLGTAQEIYMKINVEYWERYKDQGLVKPGTEELYHRFATSTEESINLPACFIVSNPIPFQQLGLDNKGFQGLLVHINYLGWNTSRRGKKKPYSGKIILDLCLPDEIPKIPRFPDAPGVQALDVRRTHQGILMNVTDKSSKDEKVANKNESMAGPAPKLQNKSKLSKRKSKENWIQDLVKKLSKKILSGDGKYAPLMINIIICISSFAIYFILHFIAKFFV